MLFVVATLCYVAECIESSATWLNTLKAVVINMIFFVFASAGVCIKQMIYFLYPA